MLWDYMVAFFKSWFNYPGAAWGYIVVGIILAVIFGGIWMLVLWPSVRKKPWLWAVAIASAFLTLVAMTFVQIPLEYYYEQGLGNAFSVQTISDWMLLVGVPTVLITGLVQEGAKMVPMVFWWLRGGKKITPKEGLIIGAMAGAGFGVFEALWMHNQVFMYGWTWASVNAAGIEALLPFWERFWAVALHIAMSALAGYGLAKGKGFQFYLLAAALHSVVNYFAILFAKQTLTYNQIEICIAGIAALVMLAAIWLRWRKDKEIPAVPLEVSEPPKPEIPADTDV